MARCDLYRLNQSNLEKIQYEIVHLDKRRGAFSPPINNVQIASAEIPRRVVYANNSGFHKTISASVFVSSIS